MIDEFKWNSGTAIINSAIVKTAIVKTKNVKIWLLNKYKKEFYRVYQQMSNNIDNNCRKKWCYKREFNDIKRNRI